jgi:hypothetical protein
MGLGCVAHFLARMAQPCLRLVVDARPLLRCATSWAGGESLLPPQEEAPIPPPPPYPYPDSYPGTTSRDDRDVWLSRSSSGWAYPGDRGQAKDDDEHPEPATPAAAHAKEVVRCVCALSRKVVGTNGEEVCGCTPAASNVSLDLCSGGFLACVSWRKRRCVHVCVPCVCPCVGGAVPWRSRAVHSLWRTLWRKSWRRSVGPTCTTAPTLRAPRTWRDSTTVT